MIVKKYQQLGERGYPDSYTDEQLEKFDVEVEPFARALAEKLRP